MASDHQASSWSQQPTANPQPALVPTGSSATSPPTKQSLKTWWKGFRPPTKAPETQGNIESFQLLESSSSPQQHFYASSNFASTVRSKRETAFHEALMNETSPVADHLTLEVAELPATSNLSSNVCSYSTATAGRVALNPEHSSDSLEISSYLDKQREETTTSVPSRSQPFSDWNRSSQNTSFTANINSDLSEVDLSAGIIPNPSRPCFICSAFKKFFQIFRRNTAEKNLAEQPTGIFGVPLRQSITYANVAISLVDAEGKSYIYGYVPIVVAKCGVYLKEKGAFG